MTFECVRNGPIYMIPHGNVSLFKLKFVMTKVFFSPQFCDIENLANFTRKENLVEFTLGNFFSKISPILW
jgi:hypothetical protein